MFFKSSPKKKKLCHHFMQYVTVTAYLQSPNLLGFFLSVKYYMELS